MNLDDARNHWQQQEPEPSTQWEELAQRVCEDARKLESKVFRRDLVETVAAILVIGFFGPWLVLFEGWVTRLGTLILILGVIEIVVVLHVTRRGGLPTRYDLPLAERIGGELRRVQRQITLLRWIAWWYLAPILLGVCLFVIGLHIPIAITVLFCVLFGAFGVFGYQVNQRAVNRELIPLRDSLKQLHSDLHQNP